MRKRELFIDTKFDDFESTDLKEHDNQREQNEDSQRNIFNQYILEQYYQGAIKLMELIHTNHTTHIVQAFQVLKQKFKHPIRQINSFESSCLWEKYLKKNRSKSKTKNIRASVSTDRFRLLNELTDKYIQRERIKSQEKYFNSRTSHVEGKKIISKLNKLERMIKDIKRQNQLSKQSSVVFSKINHQEKIPVRFISQYQYNRYHPQQKIQSPYPVYQSQFLNPIPSQQHHTQQYYGQYQPIRTPIYQPNPVISGQYFQRINNSIQSSSSSSSSSQSSDDEAQQTNEESISQLSQKQDISKELYQIRQQLKNLKNVNKQYVNTNSLNQHQTIINRQYNNQRYNRDFINNSQQPSPYSNSRYRPIHRTFQTGQVQQNPLFPDSEFKKVSRLQTQKSESNKPHYGMNFKKRMITQTMQLQTPTVPIRYNK